MFRTFKRSTSCLLTSLHLIALHYTSVPITFHPRSSLHYTSLPTTVHPRSSLHFTSLHFTPHYISPKIVTSLYFTPHYISNKIIASLRFTSLHYTSFLIFHFPPLLEVSSTPFNNPSPLLTYNHLLTLFINICDLQRTVASTIAGSRFHSFIALFTKV